MLCELPRFQTGRKRFLFVQGCCCCFLFLLFLNLWLFLLAVQADQSMNYYSPVEAQCREPHMIPTGSMQYACSAAGLTRDALKNLMQLQSQTVKMQNISRAEASVLWISVFLQCCPECLTLLSSQTPLIQYKIQNSQLFLARGII